MKDIKIFFQKKRTKGKKRCKKDIKIFSKEQKQKLLEYMSYYLAHKK